MNLALFLVLFALGFLTARIPGITFWTEFACLTTSAFVGLNPQEPVAAQTILDTFLGMAFGLWIAALVGRLLWPILPQHVLRDDLVRLCAQLQALLKGKALQAQTEAQLAVLPVEALQAIGQLRMAGCPGEERDRLAALVRALQTLAIRIGQLVSRRGLGGLLIIGHEPGSAVSILSCPPPRGSATRTQRRRPGARWRRPRGARRAFR